jgi:hypothetical protein
MNQEDITRMAREAGFVGFDGSNAMLCKFAALVAAHKREWVGLTDEEFYEYADKYLYQHGSNYGIKAFGKAIESKLKERNG